MTSCEFECCSVSAVCIKQIFANTFARTLYDKIKCQSCVAVKTKEKKKEKKEAALIHEIMEP